MLMALGLLLGGAETALSQEPPVHYLHQGVMPPGAIGSQQLQRGGPLPGYFQPVQIKGPSGSLISLAAGGQFEETLEPSVQAGMLIGAVYRLRVVQIPLNPGLEVYPTLELVNRLYPPRGQERRFAVPIELTQQDLELALQGKFVTRVIYLEDPDNATPARQALETQGPVSEEQLKQLAASGQLQPSDLVWKEGMSHWMAASSITGLFPNAPTTSSPVPTGAKWYYSKAGQSWFEVKPGQDPLAVADALGRPMAILRIGGRVPMPGEAPDESFLFGCPPFVKYAPRPQFVVPPAQPQTSPRQEKTWPKDQPST